MSARKPKILITGLCPDRINTNTRIRQAIVEGARESELFASVTGVPIELVTTLSKIDADILFAVGSGLSNTLYFEALRQRCDRDGVKLVFWTHEDPYELDANMALAELADAFFTNDSATLPYYKRNNTFWLPLGADRKYFRDIRPMSERYFDLFFCGYGYPIRLHILKRLAAESQGKQSLILFGPNLPEHLPGIASSQRLSTKEMADTAAQSLMTLNIGRDLNIANARFNVVAETPGPRTFDLALTGTPQIMFDDGVYIEEFFSPGEEILMFHSIDDIFEQLDRAARSPHEITKIAHRSQQAALDKHLYKHRIAEMMQCLDI